MVCQTTSRRSPSNGKSVSIEWSLSLRESGAAFAERKATVIFAPIAIPNFQSSTFHFTLARRIPPMTANWHIWLVSTILVVAAIIDGWRLKVPNWLTFPLVIGGWRIVSPFSVGPAWAGVFSERQSGWACSCLPTRLAAWRR